MNIVISSENKYNWERGPFALKGIVFKEYTDMVEASFGEQMIDTIIRSVTFLVELHTQQSERMTTPSWSNLLLLYL